MNEGNNVRLGSSVDKMPVSTEIQMRLCLCVGAAVPCRSTKTLITKSPSEALPCPGTLGEFRGRASDDSNVQQYEFAGDIGRVPST